MGGECNYLLRVKPGDWGLEFVPDGEWKSAYMESWTPAEITKLLDSAQEVLLDTAARLRLPVKVRGLLGVCVGSAWGFAWSPVGFSDIN